MGKNSPRNLQLRVKAAHDDLQCRLQIRGHSDVDDSYLSKHRVFSGNHRQGPRVLLVQVLLANCITESSRGRNRIKLLVLVCPLESSNPQTKRVRLGSVMLLIKPTVLHAISSPSHPPSSTPVGSLNHIHML